MAGRNPHPVAALSVAALLVAVAIGSVALLAHGRAQPATIRATADTAPVPLADVLPTPLLSVRRAPAALADDRRADLLSSSIAPLASSIDGSSCLAVGLDDRELVALNALLAVVPASNLKLVTASVAIDVLGPGYRFTTSVMGPAPVNGVIEGDVVIVGGGDPVLSDQWYTQATQARRRPPLHATDVTALVDLLAGAGVTRISGRVLGDGSRYDDERYPPAWADDVRVSPDGGAVGALVINDSNVASGAASNDPAASAAKAFAAMLDDRGISVAGSGSGPAVAGSAVLASVQSAPLVDIVNELLATSDNLTAEMMVKEMGYASVQRGTRADGLQVMMDRLVSWGIPTDGVMLTDGSGLSPDNRLTCAALSALLRRGGAGDSVGAGLALSGQQGSTLADAFLRPGLVGIMQGKTGTLHRPTEVKALGGYFAAGDSEVDFVLILNGPAALAYTTAWEQLGDALLATAGGPQAEVLAPLTSVG